MTHALIVVDMQQGSFTDTTPRHDAEGLVGRLTDCRPRCGPRAAPLSSCGMTARRAILTIPTSRAGGCFRGSTCSQVTRWYARRHATPFWTLRWRRFCASEASDGPHLTAAKIIEHHNAIWADFLAPRGPAMVLPCAEVRIE